MRRDFNGFIDIQRMKDKKQRNEKSIFVSKWQSDPIVWFDLVLDEEKLTRDILLIRKHPYMDVKCIK